MSPETYQSYTLSIFGHTLDNAKYAAIKERMEQINPVLDAHAISLHWNRDGGNYPMALNNLGITRDGLESAQKNAQKTIEKLWKEDQAYGQYTQDWNKAQTSNDIFEFELALYLYTLDARSAQTPWPQIQTILDSWSN